MPEQDEIQIDEDQGSPHQDIYEAIGQSDSFLAFQERLSKVAQVNRPVLLMGERGTGKELAAQRLHFLSRRWEGPFLALNCSALSSTLLESELFGHEAGAFTGAGSRRQGRFETASGGTLFLDEIGNIPLETQAKILRVVEYGSFERVGSSQSIKVDVRIVGATNANLKSLADSGRFLTDLLDRLSFEVLVLPPLRDRLEDIAILSNHFAARMGFELGWDQIPEVTEEAMKMMEGYAWPGNVRELKNVIERAVYRSDDYVITKEELVFDPFRAYLASRPVPGEAALEEGQAPPTRRNAPAYSLATSFQDQLKQLEAGLVETALEESKFNQKKAAELLGLTYHQFRGLYRKYQEPPENGG